MENNSSNINEIIRGNFKFFYKRFYTKKPPKMQTNDLHLDDLYTLKGIKKQFYS